MRAAGQWVRRLLIPEEPGVAEEEEREKEDRKMLNKGRRLLSFISLLSPTTERKENELKSSRLGHRHILPLPPSTSVLKNPPSSARALAQPATQFVVGPFRQQPLP